MRRHRLFIGPMSKNVLLAVDELRNENSGFDPVLIPSRRQVEASCLGTGYVNGWTSEAFTSEVRALGSVNIPIMRDHAGPDQGAMPDDGMKSLENDVACSFEGIHLDPWKRYPDVQDAVSWTIRMIGHCLNHGGSTTRFEIGTEEGIRRYDPIDLEVFLKLLSRDLPEAAFDQIDFCVVQSGTNVLGDKNVGELAEEKSLRMCEIVESYGLIPKEHNSDYLTPDDIIARRKCGVRAFNIAPEFGVIETSTILNELERHSRVESTLATDLTIMLNHCRAAEKWLKWVPEDCHEDRIWIEENKRDLTRICGHYHFNEDWFKRVRTRLSRVCDIDTIVRNKIKERLHELHRAIHCGI